jgi:hypothetical protein
VHEHVSLPFDPRSGQVSLITDAEAKHRSPNKRQRNSGTAAQANGRPDASAEASVVAGYATTGI